MKDAIDLSTVQIHGSPDVRNWPITVGLTHIDSTLNGGLTLAFAPEPPERWKWPSNPAVPSDNFQYTVWAIVRFADGSLHAQGFIQMWQGREMGNGSIPSILSHFGPDGWMGNLGGPMTQYQPQAGDQVGIFVTAGNARGVDHVTSVAERSNIVVIRLTDRSAIFLGVLDDPQPQPQTPSSPIEPPNPPVVPPNVATVGDLTASEARILARIDKLESDVLSSTKPFFDFLTRWFGVGKK